ncbi:MAG: hypothetical protein KBC30_03560 [Planctomycetes bacterium]|nr:hypothetical protein [Planctomycetota bacterium]HNZ67128.1 hypothetical protein [Planctomycetota bacterium]HON44736.1 hypothetical protein [Planctomycetota bacterium]HQB00148.1 hypothetical protein [Planctomycetota bacterium]HRU51352.1 hypothetical protein [Planctomycetota bacterium]
MNDQGRKKTSYHAIIEKFSQLKDQLQYAGFCRSAIRISYAIPWTQWQEKGFQPFPLENLSEELHDILKNIQYTLTTQQKNYEYDHIVDLVENILTHFKDKDEEVQTKQKRITETKTYVKQKIINSETKTYVPSNNSNLRIPDTVQSQSIYARLPNQIQEHERIAIPEDEYEDSNDEIYVQETFQTDTINTSTNGDDHLQGTSEESLDVQFCNQELPKQTKKQRNTSTWKLRDINQTKLEKKETEQAILLTRLEIDLRNCQLTFAPTNPLQQTIKSLIQMIQWLHNHPTKFQKEQIENQLHLLQEKCNEILENRRLNSLEEKQLQKLQNTLQQLIE